VTEAQLDAIQQTCSETPKAPLGSRYSGPVVDAHVHTALENDQGAFALALIGEMNQNGVSRVLIQADHSPGLTADPGPLELYREVEASWGRIASVCDRIIPLIYAFDPTDSSAWAYVKERLATGNYGGVGEIEFLHTRMGIRKPVHSDTMDRIYEALEAGKMIFHFQAEPAGEPELGKEIAELIESHPGIRFVWFGGEACFDQPGVENLLCTVFPSRGLKIVQGLTDWQKVRLVLGTDASPAGLHSSSAGHLPYASLGDGVGIIRDLLAPMQPSTAAAVGHGNFDRLVK